ncbi:MAG TPA: carboxypeptidase-like regulatory domain-containing protein [Prolixibacteraceae bacterium]|nr:carboxypeptidase-like regulatory domain-containing protein [Prolixibacteraceae bacterium]
MRFTLLLLLLLLSINLSAQQKKTISGYITDAQTGERLYAATVYEQNSGTGTISNRFGFYSLSLTEGTVMLKFSFVGYKPQTRMINLQGDTLLTVTLQSDNTLGEVTVKGNLVSALGHTRISSKTLAKLPSLMGEKDVMKSLMLLPGVQQGSEGSSGIFVRGGSPDQNLILLDDVPLYNVSHLFGFVSVFTPEAINSIDFYTGGFPARYGGRLSSVIDLRMKDGNKHKHETNINLGLISSQLTTEGPIKKGESSYFFSARRTLLDLVFKGIAKVAQRNTAEKAIPSYGFHDLNGKVNFKLNERNHLYWSFYSGKDKLAFEYSDHIKTMFKEDKQETSGALHWGNVMTALKLNSQLNSRLFLNTTLSGSLFNYGNLFDGSTWTKMGEEESESHFSLKYQSQIRSVGFKSDLDIYGKSNLPFQIGWFASASNYLPGRQTVRRNNQSDQYSSNEISGLDYGMYIDKRFYMGRQFSMAPGLRTVFHTILNEKTYFAAEPRLSLTFRQNKNTSYHLSYAVMTQAIHLLSNGNVGLPTDIWVPSTRIIRPESSEIFSAGIKKTITPQLKASVEAYYKRLDRVISFTEGEGIMDVDQNWEQKVTSGKGRASGLETELRYTTFRIESWIGYTLARNERKFEDINKGRWFPYQYDRRHKLDVGIIMPLGNNWSGSATWTYQSGAPASYSGLDYPGSTANPNDENFDIFTGRPIIGDRIQYYPSINGVRLPAYHRLDIGFTKEWEAYGKKRALSLSAYNVYSRQNPYYVFAKTKPDGTTGLKQFSLFPIIPSISYRISF